jgi:uncharacterized membrane protein YphA (DoxX/SURF4 family)
MKLLIFAARLLMGLMFIVFGFNHIVPIIHLPMPTGDAGAMMGLMFVHKWLLFYGVVEVAAGMMLFLGRFVPLGLTLLAGIISNIVLFHITLEPSGLPLAVFTGLLELVLVYAYRASFAGIFAGKADPTLM